MDEAFDEVQFKKSDWFQNWMKLMSYSSASQRVLDATQIYLSEIGFSTLTAEEEVFYARRALRGM